MTRVHSESGGPLALEGATVYLIQHWHGHNNMEPMDAYWSREVAEKEAKRLCGGEICEEYDVEEITLH